MIHSFWFILVMLSVPKLSYDIVVPAIEFKYQTDEYDWNQSIKVQIPIDNLAGLAGAQARLFPSRYVADPDDPIQVAINTTPSHCKIFKAKAIRFKPDLQKPFVQIGTLEANDLRCVGNQLMPTVCYLVVTKDHLGDSIQLDPDAVDDYFAYSYRFVVNAPPGGRCSSGTEKADHAEEAERRSNPKSYAKKKQFSVQEQRKAAAMDGPKACATVKP